jgi:uncharacterized protein
MHTDPLSSAPVKKPASPYTRWLYLALAWICLALGVIGVVLPVLPTTPFILAAAWAAARGSTRLHEWMRNHKRFGAAIRDWEETGSVSRKAKWWATSMMTLSCVTFFLTAPKLWMAFTGTGILASVATWLWFRPEPGKRTAEAQT